MPILPIVYELLSLNKEKINQLKAEEKILTSINLSNDNFPKIKAYNTGVCVFVTSNFNYLLDLPKEYKKQFSSRKISINSINDIYLTFFNKIISTDLHCFITKKTIVEDILDVYLKYLQFIQNTNILYNEFKLNKTQYNIKCEKYNVFITRNYFFKKTKQKNSLVCIEVSN